MTAPAGLAAGTPIDEMDVFLPGIAPDERERRVKLRELRNVASAMIGSTDSATARQLAWIVTEYATEALYAPAAAEALNDLNKLCKRLMLTALQAEHIDLFGAGE